MKGFILMRKGFEYNDEIMYEPEGGGGTPTKIFFQKDLAEVEMVQRNIKEFKETDLAEYTYDLEDILTVPEEDFKKFQSLLLEKYGKPKSTSKYNSGFGEYQLHPSASDEESLQFAKMVTVSFFEVMTADIDEQSHRDHKLDKVVNS